MDLQAKRTILVAQRDQLMANLNATSGAIALCEELLSELENEKALAEVIAEHAAAHPREVWPPTAPDMLPVVHGDEPWAEADTPREVRHFQSPPFGSGGL